MPKVNKVKVYKKETKNPKVQFVDGQSPLRFFLDLYSKHGLSGVLNACKSEYKRDPQLIWGHYSFECQDCTFDEMRRIQIRYQDMTKGLKKDDVDRRWLAMLSQLKFSSVEEQASIHADILFEVLSSFVKSGKITDEIQDKYTITMNNPCSDEPADPRHSRVLLTLIDLVAGQKPSYHSVSYDWTKKQWVFI